MSQPKESDKCHSFLSPSAPAYSSRHACFSRQSGVTIRFSPTRVLIGGREGSRAHWAPAAVGWLRGGGSQRPFSLDRPHFHQSAPLPQLEELSPSSSTEPPNPKARGAAPLHIPRSSGQRSYPPAVLIHALGDPRPAAALQASLQHRVMQSTGAGGRRRQQ